MVKQISLLVILFGCGFALPASGQLPKYLQKSMAFIPGGTFDMGGGFQYRIDHEKRIYLGQDTLFGNVFQQGYVLGELPKPNNPRHQETVADFYMFKTEVSNSDYIEFLYATIFGTPGETDFPTWDEIPMDQMMKKALEKGLLPDTNAFNRYHYYSYGEPLNHYYFRHPAYRNYPVVGVSWFQATAYCEWLSRFTNAKLTAEEKDTLPHFRLPTEAEWEYAARGQVDPEGNNLPQRHFPWPGFEATGKKGKPLANFCNQVSLSDNYFEGAPVEAFAPNEFGLYQMAGNVAEWTADNFEVNPFEEYGIVLKDASANLPDDSKVVKGGSWRWDFTSGRVGNRGAFSGWDNCSVVGFRVVMSAPAQKEK